MTRNACDIIRDYFSTPELSFEQEGLELGIGDDAALIQIPNANSLSISTDVLVEGVHFPKNANPSQIAKRALSVNLSDLAAMAAIPHFFTLGLVLPSANEDWLSEFSAGLGEIAQKYRITLIGGDLSKGPMAIAIQVHGLSPVGKALRRDGAKIEDELFVTGPLGEGAIGLLCVGGKSHLGSSFKFLSDPPNKIRNYFEEAYYQPTPRIDFALTCREYISSAIDISDGLVGDLKHLVRASGTGAIVEVEKVPVSREAQCFMTADNLRRAALYGGDDYELCVTVPPNKTKDFIDQAKKLGIEVIKIGKIITGKGVELVSSLEKTIPVEEVKAFTHF
jgi:thiamine-monophosphate kinase